MRIAKCVIDVTTRKVDKCFSYLVPRAMEVSVGETVLVPFGGRACVAYVLTIDNEVEDVALDKLKEIQEVIAPSAFDEVGAQLILWIQEEYAAVLSDVVRLFVAPGQKFRVYKDSQGAGHIDDGSTKSQEEKWLRLKDATQEIELAQNAKRQKQIVELLQAGPMPQKELLSFLPSSASSIKKLEEKGFIESFLKRRIRSLDMPSSLSSAKAVKPLEYSAEQKEALKTIEAARKRKDGSVVLIDGVTGSGKTEVYLAAIERCLAEGQDAIVLVPEISLTAQTVGRFRSRFGDNVAILHSRLSKGERYDQWDLLRQGVCHVVVGARSALFAPFKQLGLIIIDEEHESSYKQDSSPRYHAREVAQKLCELRGATLILGSATPSFEALERSSQGSYRGQSYERVRMTERAGDASLPEVTLINMAEQFHSQNRSVFSRPLKAALLETYEQGKKSVLLLNRRGFANFLMCRDCGCVPECPYCSQALTYHERTHNLMCHSCGRSWPTLAYPNPMAKCPNCGSRYMAAYGIGTQRVEDELRELLGEDAAIIRMDADTTRTKGAHQKLLEEFDAKDASVLIGTQMIAKGLDFPDVCLVGVINADSTLKLPDFRAEERTYDLLEQVAGRAGRGASLGHVYIQSYWSTHPALLAVKSHDRESFVKEALAQRKELGYPPYGRVSNVVFWGTNELAVKKSAHDVCQALQEKLTDDFELLGPSPCLKERVNGKYRWHLLLKSTPEAAVGTLLHSTLISVRIPKGIQVSIDVDAYDVL